MSRWNNKSNRIAEFLTSQAELEGIPVSVHRLDSLVDCVNQQMAKADGNGCVIIKWLGGQNPDRSSARLRIGARFSISLWTVPMDADGAAIPADDLIELLAERLHGWIDSTPGALIHRLEVTSVGLVPDALGFIVHEILAEIVRV